jgi:hypothetical protein
MLVFLFGFLDWPGLARLHVPACRQGCSCFSVCMVRVRMPRFYSRKCCRASPDRLIRVREQEAEVHMVGRCRLIHDKTRSTVII